MGLEFPRSARLRDSAVFRAIRDSGRSFASRYLLVGVLVHDEPAAASAFGIVTSKRVGNAVIRARVRRRLREIVRQNRPHIRSGWWVVLVARKAAATADYATLEDEVLRLFKRASILPPAS